MRARNFIADIWIDVVALIVLGVIFVVPFAFIGNLFQNVLEMTVDAQGYVWSARWVGSALYRYTPEGIEEQRIEFPARKVSSVAFGGDDLSDLYVTTALTDGTKAEEGAGAGALFRLRMGIRGLPEFFSRVKI